MKSSKNVAVAIVFMVAVPFAAEATVVISNDPTQNMSCKSGLCQPTNKSAVLNLTDLTNMLANGDLIVRTGFFVKHPRDAGTIDLNAPLSWAGSSQLTLDARDAIDLNAPITIATTGRLTMGGNFTPINVGASIVVMGAGALTFEEFPNFAPNANVTFEDLNGELSIGGAPFTLVGDVPSLVADIAAGQGKGWYALANDYDAANDVFRKPPIPDFKGAFTGLGHSIAGLRIKKGFADCEGFVSKNEGVLRDIDLHNAKVTSTKEKNVGALAGCNYGNISNVSVDGTVTGNSNANVGGVAGANTPNGGIGLARAAVTVSGGQAGGIVGENDNYLYEVYATGSVTGSSNTGGLIGANKLSVQQGYSTASVNGGGGAAGGLAGFNSATILDCYSTGTVTGTGYVGGFVGYDPNESVSYGYWDLDTSGTTQGVGFPVSDPSAIGLTTAQLQSRLPSGFDKGYWALDPNINDGFPYLRDLPPQ